MANEVMRARPVTGENEQTALRLRVDAGQEGFVETVEACLAEAKALSVWRPFLLYTQNRAGGKRKVFRPARGSS